MSQKTAVRSNTDWLRDAKWGVFIHFLAGVFMPKASAEDWNRCVDAFDVDGLAEQLGRCGARYLFLTLGQDTGHYCAPNAAYDRFVGVNPSKCSRRDLVIDLHDALEPHGIRLLAYHPSGAPGDDPVAVERLKWRKFDYGTPGERLAQFQAMWEEVIRDWSVRWGTKCSGWWFDGCYFADAMYRHSDPPNFASFAAAAKAGNPESIIAFNPGVKVPVISLTEHEDYTAGEISDAFPAYETYNHRPGRWVDGAQYHILSYLGGRWGYDDPRFPDEFVVGYTKHVNSHEGVVTWEVPIQANGLIREPFVRQLEALGKAVPRAG